MPVRITLGVALLVYLCSPYPGVMGELVRLLDMVFVLIPLFLFLLIALFSKQSFLPSTKLILLMLMLIMFQMLSLFASQTTVSVISDALDLGKAAALFFAFLFGLLVCRYVDARFFMRVFVGVFLLSSSVAFLQYLLGPSVFLYAFSGRDPGLVAEQFSFRVIGTIGNPNFFAIFNSMAAFTFLGAWLRRGKKVHIILFFVAIAMIMLAQSRTNTIFFALALIVFILVSLRAKWLQASRRNVLLIGTFASLSLGAGALLLYASSLPDSYLVTGVAKVFGGELMEQNSFKTRVEIWRDYFGMIVKRPWLGHSASKGYYMYDFADNNYIFLLFKYGVVGLSCYLLFYTVVLWRAARMAIDTGESYAFATLFLGVSLLTSSLTAESMESMRLAPVFFMLSGVVVGKGRQKRVVQ